MGNYPDIMVSRHAIRGFTLTEALVAILVLSIGLLGVAGMQLKALQSAHAGYQRAIASLAAQDAVELLWSGVGAETCPEVSLIDRGVPDSWVSRWQKFLPGLEQPFISSPSDDCVYQIKVKWDDERFGGENYPSLTFTTRLPKGHR